MRSAIPHPIPYQGSKRRLATAILSYTANRKERRLVEPFAGSAAVTLAAAKSGLFSSYVLADALDPLAELWEQILDKPSSLADRYSSLWHREQKNPIEAFYEIRTEFNTDKEPAKLLYLLARCVKNAVRFNPRGEFNQSPDKRRQGTHPDTMRTSLVKTHSLLSGKTTVRHADFMELISNAREGDMFYLDPPYQGTSEGRDSRYISGVPRELLMEGLTTLNKKGVPFVLSYDGYLGEKSYGSPLPPELAQRVLLDVGRSSQSTLNGKKDSTVESLYLSPLIEIDEYRSTYNLSDFSEQPILFA
jgi:DNA adenine methylase